MQLDKDTLREVTVKIGLGKINTQKGIIVKTLLDSKAISLVMSSEYIRKQGFKLKKILKKLKIIYILLSKIQ